MPRDLSPSDRMTLVGIGELLAPGCCMVCGNGTCQQGYVRLGVFFAYEGECYLCHPCATQTGETAGGLSSTEGLETIENYKKAAALLTVAHEELKAANAELDAYRAIISRNATVPAPTRKSVGLHDDNDAFEYEGDLLTLTEEPDGGTEAVPELTESVKDDGHSDASRDASGNRFNI